MSTADARLLDILNDGRLERLDYDGQPRLHYGDSTWGTTGRFEHFNTSGTVSRWRACGIDGHGR